jgi:ABC-type dipeptide/oligopeptide/nickel transport system permease subunit
VFFIRFVVAIAVVGFGVPIIWLLVAAVIQGEAGQARMTVETAVAIFPGICITYALVAYLAGALAARRWSSEKRVPRTIHPWMRSMRDEPTKPEPPTSLEMVFILAALAISVAFLIWFFVWAGSPLPSN